MDQHQVTAWFASVSNALGYAGASLIVLAYFLNQRGTLRSDDWRYPATNLLGSLLVLLSLIEALNPPSAMIELFWSAISIYGIQRNLRVRRRVVKP